VGAQKENLPKNVPGRLSLIPISEPQPFDVYMVDGRAATALFAALVLHAHARG
jgi:hypothetical protein